MMLWNTEAGIKKSAHGNIIRTLKFDDMENPFELILNRLNAIEELLRTLMKNDKGAVVLTASIPNVINLNQAAEYVSLSKSTMYKKTAERTIPHFKQGKKLYFKRSELDDWLTAQKISTHAEIEKEADEYIRRKGRFKF